MKKLKLILSLSIFMMTSPLWADEMFPQICAIEANENHTYNLYMGTFNDFRNHKMSEVYYQENLSFILSNLVSYLKQEICLLPLDRAIFEKDFGQVLQPVGVMTQTSLQTVTVDTSFYDYYMLTLADKKELLKNSSLPQKIKENIFLSGLRGDFYALYQDFNQSYSENDQLNQKDQEAHCDTLKQLDQFDKKYYRDFKIHYVDSSYSLVKSLEQKSYHSTCHYMRRHKNGGFVPVTPLWSYLTGIYDFDYCISREEGSQSNDVLYYFPGLTSDSSSWMDLKSLREMRNNWRKEGLEIPITISLSLGKMISYMEKGKFELFQEATSYIEHKELSVAPPKRLAIGISLGGANLAKVILEQPEFFSKVYIESAGFWRMSPYVSDHDLRQYVKETDANYYLLKYVIIPIAKKKIPKTEEDESNLFNLAKRSSVLTHDKFPEYLFVSAVHDELGVQHELKAFHDLLQDEKNIRRGEFFLIESDDEEIPVLYSPLIRKGGHTIEPIKKMSDFIRSDNFDYSNPSVAIPI